MSELNGTVALVTGGTKGIGRAIAQALIDAGGRVAIGARTQRDVDRTVAELNARAHDRAFGIACDVARLDDCHRLADETARTFGRIDVLINNAGIGRFANVADLDPAAWREVIGTNLDGVFYCTHAVIPHLRRAGGGWIINIGSLAGKNPFAGGAAYNASKFGLVGFSEAIMQDLRYDDIRVSCIMPGSVSTEFGGPTGTTQSWKIQPEDIGRLVVDLVTMPARALPSRIEVRPSKPPRKN
jgi:NAD(P)-dependent dehydrogenase (short-subunit alcohol dehydrogenase family)